MSVDIAAANAAVAGKGPAEIISHALALGAGKPMVSTNFRPGEAVILHMLTQVCPGIAVLWVDHGYNTPDTYRCAQQLIERLELNVTIESPDVTTAYRDAALGGIPSLDDEEAHKVFTEERKLAPFRRGMQRVGAGTWFTAVRREQTALRANMEYFGLEGELLKVSPLLDWSEAEMEAYLAEHDLPDEKVYFDPTKVEGNRECGLHEGLHSKR